MLLELALFSLHLLVLVYQSLLDHFGVLKLLVDDVEFFLQSNLSVRQVGTFELVSRPFLKCLLQLHREFVDFALYSVKNLTFLGEFFGLRIFLSEQSVIILQTLLALLLLILKLLLQCINLFQQLCHLLLRAIYIIESIFSCLLKFFPQRLNLALPFKILVFPSSLLYF